MISGHFPFTYGHSHAWLILIVLMALGALTRHYFNLRHKGRNEWWILAGAALGVIVLAILIRPTAGGRRPRGRRRASRRCRRSSNALRAVPLAATRRSRATPHRRRDPARHARADRAQANLIRAVAVDTQTMPLGNATK